MAIIRCNTGIYYCNIISRRNHVDRRRTSADRFSSSTAPGSRPRRHSPWPPLVLAGPNSLRKRVPCLVLLVGAPCPSCFSSCSCAPVGPITPAARFREQVEEPYDDGCSCPGPTPAGVRVDEGSTRFEISPGAGVADVRVVVARFPFEPSGWIVGAERPRAGPSCRTARGRSRCSRSGSSTARTRSCGGRSYGRDYAHGRNARQRGARPHRRAPIREPRRRPTGPCARVRRADFPSASQRPPEGPGVRSSWRRVFADAGRPSPVLPASLKRGGCRGDGWPRMRVALTWFSSQTTRRMPLAQRIVGAGAKSSARSRVAATSVRMRPEALPRLREGGRGTLDHDLRACLQAEPGPRPVRQWTDRCDGTAVHGR